MNDSIADCSVLGQLAQLNNIRKKRKLTNLEIIRLTECLNWIEQYFWDHALLANLSLMAHMSDDIDWQHDICRSMEEYNA
jgi:hypothetical protein